MSKKQLEFKEMGSPVITKKYKEIISSYFTLKTKAIEELVRLECTSSKLHSEEYAVCENLGSKSITECLELGFAKHAEREFLRGGHPPDTENGLNERINDDCNQIKYLKEEFVKKQKTWLDKLRELRVKAAGKGDTR